MRPEFTMIESFHTNIIISVIIIKMNLNAVGVYNLYHPETT